MRPRKQLVYEEIKDIMTKQTLSKLTDPADHITELIAVMIQITAIGMLVSLLTGTKWPLYSSQLALGIFAVIIATTNKTHNTT